MPRLKMRVLYEETYAKESAHVRRELNPILPHVTAPFEVADVFVTRAGRVERNGEQMEFQDLRVYLRRKV